MYKCIAVHANIINVCILRILQFSFLFSSPFEAAYIKLDHGTKLHEHKHTNLLALGFASKMFGGTYFADINGFWIINRFC